MNRDFNKPNCFCKGRWPPGGRRQGCRAAGARGWRGADLQGGGGNVLSARRRSIAHRGGEAPWPAVRVRARNLGGQIGEASSAREREGEHTGSGVARCARAPRRRGCRAGRPPAAAGAQGHPAPKRRVGRGAGGLWPAAGAWCGVDWWNWTATGWAGLARD